ncbi:hypothetical protein [Blastococcus saxobsidens]|uniref:Uncharacterized protein n=1 Tax=Blastococcus saxobsidens (strain DD2) TaxID=1146883 RepID=H6RXC7_BLASD|nr:hypothetical protein [Blastococcus saxobsidens]CCG04738.1 conserved exported protein of unknown function [Blastococcus saxobsidens DD2]
MSNHRLHVAAAVVLALLLSACAGKGGNGGNGGSAAGPSPEPQPDPATVVLQVSEVGGFTTPALLAGRVPSVTVYSDGRVITDGPVPAIWPAPALPNLQLYQLDDGGVRELVEQALAAGVTETTDLGSPPLADVTSTRITVRTGGEIVTREVYALGIGAPRLPDDGPAAPADDGSGLTEEQMAARAELSALVDALRNPGEVLGAEWVTEPEPYVPEAVAALVSPYVDPAPDLPQPEVAWPGPPLPGEPIAPGVTCVTATGEQADAVLAAAADASGATPWTTDDGTRWSVVLRPLLPHESGCDDLVD